MRYRPGEMVDLGGLEIVNDITAGILCSSDVPVIFRSSFT